MPTGKASLFLGAHVLLPSRHSPVQSQEQKHQNKMRYLLKVNNIDQNDVNDLVLVSLLLTLNKCPCDGINPCDRIIFFSFRGVFQAFIVSYILKMNFLICSFKGIVTNLSKSQRREEHLCSRTLLIGCFWQMFLLQKRFLFKWNWRP